MELNHIDHNLCTYTKEVYQYYSISIRPEREKIKKVTLSDKNNLTLVWSRREKEDNGSVKEIEEIILVITTRDI